MKKTFVLILCFLSAFAIKAFRWPDGTKADRWFDDTTKVDVSRLGKMYKITDYGVTMDSNIVQTKAIQAVIDKASAEGGGVIVVPRGTFLSGSLFFKPKTHLHLADGARLKGSDRITHFRLMETRIEGETCRYFAALVNADGVDGFTITGHGTIDGNGYNYWDEFRIRLKWDPQWTNKDTQRPRLVYISNARDVTLQDVHLVNSPFWTTHLYNSHHVRYLGCTIYAPTSGLKAPSSDAIDIDKCHDVLVNNCYMNVNDDAVVLKGGKGTYADTMSVNGPVECVLIQNCRFDTVHALLTLGSESIHDRNIILRNSTSHHAQRVLWLKMRPDTPQLYEYITVENITGWAQCLLFIHPWTQFFNLKERKDMPKSACRHVTLRNINMRYGNAQKAIDVVESRDYDLEDFSFENVSEGNTFRSYKLYSSK